MINLMFTMGTKLIKPLELHIAVDGKYEEGLVLRWPYSDYSKGDIEKLLSSLSKNAVIEFFYETNDGRTSYFGIKYKPDSTTSMSVQEFIYRSINTFASDQSFDIFVPAIGKALNNDEATFLSSRPSFVELGVNEWWFTYGPLLIWKEGDPVLTREALVDKLASREDLQINPKNFVGVEATFMSPIEHWFTTQVSHQEHGDFILNLDQILAATNLIT